jgi:anaphase-promoting complex subunit 2
LLERLVEWYEEWIPPPEYVSFSLRFTPYVLTFNVSLGPSVNSIFTTAFQTHIFSALPRSFTAGLATLIRWTMSPPPETLTVVPPTITDGTIWTHFETLGLVDRYESVLTGTCYAHIEQHVRASCAGEFAQPMLVPLRSWMADNILPWMVHPFAQTARTREERMYAWRFSFIILWQRRRPGSCCKVSARGSISTCARHCATSGTTNEPFLTALTRALPD